MPWLQECTIQGCGTKDLTIENCPQLKSLNVQNNALTSLEFLKGLEDLEELEIDDNIEISSGSEHLPKNLKSFSYKNTNLKPFQDLALEKLKLELKYDNLKKFLKDALASLSQETKKELAIQLGKKMEKGGSISASANTQELILNAEEVIESVKELKEGLEKELKETKQTAQIVHNFFFQN